MEKITNIVTKTVEVKTTNYQDQNPGTSGLRKKVTVFQKPHYLENFVQSIFLAHNKEEYFGKTLIVGGDGRYYNDTAIDTIVKISLANGIKKILIPETGILSTPCVSLIIRNTENSFGGVILSASHNPGGPTEDFGIKFNSSNGAPAPESVTNKIFENTKTLTSYKTLDYTEKSLFGVEANFTIDGQDGYSVAFIDTVKDYSTKMQEQFDFELIKGLFKKKGFSFLFDGMHGASGPYATEIFGNIFGVDSKNLLNCNVLPDFGGHHPDPNLVYAEELVKKLNINKSKNENVIQFGAACDGDADRNMILGWECFVSPSDSLAVIAANTNNIKAYKNKGLVGVARSMPTSSAVNRVALAKNVHCYEVPTGWKFFGNLMDADKINLCGEESFGTSSNHIREKDGVWAVLAWLSILADRNKDYDEFKVTVNDIMQEHWKTYGRDYYCRYDYEGLSLDEAKKVVDNIESNFENFRLKKEENKAFIFEYTDPIDGSVSKNQGWVYAFGSEARVIFRKSGTSSDGVTIRIYFEKYEKTEINLDLAVAINELVSLALDYSGINKVSGRNGPTVIT